MRWPFLRMRRLKDPVLACTSQSHRQPCARDWDPCSPGAPAVGYSSAPFPVGDQTVSGKTEGCTGERGRTAQLRKMGGRVDL